MTKKIIYIILGGMLVAILVGLAWWWFFNRTANAPTPSQNGTFGTAQNATSNSSLGSSAPTNVASTIPSSEAQTSAGGASIGSRTVYNPATGVVTILPASGSSVTTINNTQTSGAIWLSGTPAGTNTNTNTSVTTTVGNTDTSAPTIASVAAQGTVFNPTAVDLSGTSLDTNIPEVTDIQLNSTNPNKGLGLGGTVGVAAAAGAATCLMPSLAAFVASSFSLSVLANSISGGAVGTAANPVTVKTDSPSAALGNKGNTLANASSNVSNNLNLSINLSDIVQSRILDCFARQVAKAMLQQVVMSTVSWINSGFHGSPSFVQNPTTFFTNVADQAAGNFIKSSSLSFLCSPFQLQIKIAIAQSYANRNAQQCTLTKVIGNITNFMNGDFSSGGWAGMLSFTGVPTNNPYGAFAYASIGLQTAVNTAVNQKQNDLRLSGGFLSVTQETNCNNTNSPGAASASKSVTTVSPGNGIEPATYRVCDLKVVTPGTAIAQSLDKALGVNTQELSTAQYFDQIIGALVGQLIQNIAYKGLGNLSSNGNGYTTVDNSGDVSSSIQQSILQNVPSLNKSAQQLINIETQNVKDIQTVLTQAQTLKNCWLNAATASTTISSDQIATALQNASSTDPIITDLTSRLSTYQANISTANSNIASAQGYQSQANSTTDLATLENEMNDMAAQIQNGAFTTDADVVNAQEDQLGLQSTLSSDSQEIATGLQQCNAY